MGIERRGVGWVGDGGGGGFKNVQLQLQYRQVLIVCLGQWESLREQRVNKKISFKRIG